MVLASVSALVHVPLWLDLRGTPSGDEGMDKLLELFSGVRYRFNKACLPPPSGAAIAGVLHEATDVADDDDCWRGPLMLGKRLRERAQRGRGDLLIGPGTAADDRHRGGARAPGGDKGGGPSSRPRDPHVDRERSGECRERLEIDWADFFVGLMPRDDREIRCGGPAREWHIRCGCSRERRGHSGDDLHRNAGSTERGGLLGEPAEDAGIPPFEPHHAPSRRGELDQEPPGSLSGIAVGGVTGDRDPDRPRTGQIEDRRGDQRVVDDRFGRAEPLEATERDQLGVARPGPDKRHAAVVGERIGGGRRAVGGSHDLLRDEHRAAIGLARSGPLRGSDGRATL